MMYNQPYGGSAYWQETQNVHPDADGGYTVLLGETTLGGLPADIVAPGGIHWLGVQVSGQPEQPRLLLVEMPSTFKPDPMSATSSVSKSATQNHGTERTSRSFCRRCFSSGPDDVCGSGQMVEKTNGAIRTSAFSQPDTLHFWPREALACNPSALVSSLGPSGHSWAFTSFGAEHR